MVIYITAPPKNKQPKKIIRCLHPLASRPPPASSPHVAPALFDRSSVRLYVWLVVASSLCPLSSRPVPSLCHATSFAASRLSSSLWSRRRRVVASSRHRVSSRLVVVSRPLTHLVTPALFDCCIVALHLIVTASFCLFVLSCRPSRRVVVSSRSIS